MSQCDVKADENAYIPCISILFGRFSEECEQVLPSNKSTCPNHEQREECAWANRSTSGVSAWNVVNKPLTPFGLAKRFTSYYNEYAISHSSSWWYSMARPKSQDKRNALLAAAIELIAEQGLSVPTSKI